MDFFFFFPGSEAHFFFLYTHGSPFDFAAFLHDDLDLSFAQASVQLSGGKEGQRVRMSECDTDYTQRGSVGADRHTSRANAPLP